MVLDCWVMDEAFKEERKSHLLITCTSPDSRSTCLIHLLAPCIVEAELLPMAETCAISSPFPTGRNTERTRRRDAPSRTHRHLKVEEAVVLELAFLHTSTAPLGLNFASLRTLEKSFRRESTTKKSTPINPSIASSASPTMISGDMPASPILWAYSDLDRSSGTTHTCRPPVWRLATARPMLVGITPPCDHVSTMSCAFHPAAMAETSSATPDSRKIWHCTNKNSRQG